MPDHNHPPVDSLTYGGDLNVFRSKAELLGVIASLKENLKWYVEERNRLVGENDSLRAEIGLERIKTHNALELLPVLQELHMISGEANIPMDNSKAVRLMGKFLAAREKAESAIQKAKSPPQQIPNEVKQ